MTQPSSERFFKLLLSVFGDKTVSDNEARCKVLKAWLKFALGERRECENLLNYAGRNCLRLLASLIALIRRDGKLFYVCTDLFLFNEPRFNLPDGVFKHGTWSLKSFSVSFLSLSFHFVLPSALMRFNF